MCEEETEQPLQGSLLGCSVCPGAESSSLKRLFPPKGTAYLPCADGATSLQLQKGWQVKSAAPGQPQDTGIRVSQPQASSVSSHFLS